jgi:hypothetical protein
MIFFDLEFYVPHSYRNQTGKRGTLVFNPTFSDQILLGGCFYCKSLKDSHIYRKENLWIWNFESEKELLKQIYQLFKEEFILNQRDLAIIQNKRIKDIVTCGFGIARIDLPTLYIKSVHHKIESASNLFNMFLKTKIIDLCNVSSFLFPNEIVLYPKTANEVSKKISPKGAKKANGKKVWEYYDKDLYHKIEDRCEQEVMQIMEVYNHLQLRIGKLTTQY